MWVKKEVGIGEEKGKKERMEESKKERREKDYSLSSNTFNCVLI